jgi:hypothetical protein
LCWMGGGDEWSNGGMDEEKEGWLEGWMVKPASF